MSEKLLAVLVVAIGTYMTRFLPFKLKDKFRKLSSLDEFLTYSSTALISALFVTSFVSFQPHEFAVRTVAMVFVILTYLRWKNLGISVISGVVGYFVVNTIL